MKSPIHAHHVRILAFGALGLVLVGATGCVSTDEYKSLHTSFDQARAQLAEAENDNASLRTRNAQLEAKIADLQKLIDTSAGGSDALAHERDLLQQQLADLQKKYDELVKLAGSGPALPAPVNAALRDVAAKYPDLLEFDERSGMLRLKSDVTFDVGSTVVKPRAKEALAKIAQILDMPEIKDNEIQVIGNTDDIPVRRTSTMQMNPTNWILSTNRAWAVLDVLHANGLPDNRGMASGWGDQRPVAPNAPGHRGNPLNRRVDIYIRPTKVPQGLVVSQPGASGSRSSTPRRRTTTTRPAGGLVPAPMPSDNGVPIPR